MTPWALVVDPGKLCGLALWNQDQGVTQVWEAAPLEALRACEVLMADLGDRLTVAYERFTFLDPTKSRQYEATETIGGLKYLTYKYGCPLVEQTPKEARSLGSKERLVALDWWRWRAGESDDDQTSALRHLLLLLVKTFHLHDLVRST